MCYFNQNQNKIPCNANHLRFPRRDNSLNSVNYISNKKINTFFHQFGLHLIMDVPLPVCGVAVHICSKGTSSLGLFPFLLWSLFPFPGLPVWGNVLHCEICWRVSLISGFWLFGKWCSCWYWPLGPLGKICVHRRRLDVNLKIKIAKNTLFAQKRNVFAQKRNLCTKTQALESIQVLNFILSIQT